MARLRSPAARDHLFHWSVKAVGCCFLCRFDNSELGTHEGGWLLGLIGANRASNTHIPSLVSASMCLGGSGFVGDAAPLIPLPSSIGVAVRGIEHLLMSSSEPNRRDAKVATMTNRGFSQWVLQHALQL